MTSFFNSPQNRANLELYLKQAHQQHQHLDMSLFQSGQERDFSFVSLDAFFVPLRLGGRPPLFDEPQEGAPRQQRDGDIIANQLLHPDRRPRPPSPILGDAGSGKATSLRHLGGELA